MKPNDPASIIDCLNAATWNNNELFSRGDAGALLILARISERLVSGHTMYGASNPVKDKRVWLEEMAQEMYDQVLYAEMEMIRDEHKP